VWDRHYSRVRMVWRLQYLPQMCNRGKTLLTLFFLTAFTSLNCLLIAK
jgi:hypothetical protein